jgi:DNA polymerase III gamma/tau subunit
MNLPLITKYRPTDFDEVIGHAEMMAAVQRAIGGDTRPHAYLLTGPSGLGKTTIARIIATHLGCEVQEIDAASNNGVDDMRGLVESAQHMSLSGAGGKAIIIDECHMLSKSAWQVLLKLLEEPPAHLFLMLCTTELGKVPETILTRCFHVVLKPLSPDEMMELILLTEQLEGWTIHDDVVQAIMQASRGSPRMALALLDVGHDAPSRDELMRIVTLTEAGEALQELIQYLVKGGKAWDHIKTILERVEEDQLDSALIGMGRYITVMMLRAPEDQARKAWHILEALHWPISTFDRKAAFYAAIGRVVWGG